MAPARFSLTIRANALTQPVAHKQLAALQAPTLLALVLAFRLWLQIATVGAIMLQESGFQNSFILSAWWRTRAAAVHFNAIMEGWYTASS